MTGICLPFADLRRNLLRHISRVLQVVLLSFGILGSVITTHSADIPEDQNFEPLVKIPKLNRSLNLSPEVRLIGAGTFEWTTAIAVSGFLLTGAEGEPDLGLVPGLDASIHMGYTDDSLYVGFLMPMPQGVTPRAEANANQAEGILKDDHFAIRLSFESRAEAATQPHFEFQVNSAGYYRAVEREFLPGQTRVIGEGAVRVTSYLATQMGFDWWSIKMEIPLAAIGKTSLDGEVGLLQASLKLGDMDLVLPGPAWDGAFAATFATEMPSIFRVNGSFPGLLRSNSQLVATWDLRPRSDGRVIIRGETGNSAPLFEVEENLQSGKVAKFSVKEQIPPDVKAINTTLVWLSPDGQSTTLYQAPWPVIQENKTALDRLAAWVKDRSVLATPEIRTDYVFDPYTGKIEIFVNRSKPVGMLDESGQAKMDEILAANSITGEVRDSEGTVLAQATGTIIETVGSVRLDLGADLPDGDYVVVGQVVDNDTVVATNEIPLLRKRAPWEKTSLGKDAVVFPPFREITLESNTLSLLGRDYSIGGNGLPAAITSQGKAMLGGPIRLEARADGKILPIEFGPPEISLIPGKKFPESFDQYMFQATSPIPELEPTEGYQAEVSSTGRMDGLQVKVAGRMEFEGLYRVDLTLDASKPVAVDAFDLVIPLNNAFNTMKFTRNYGLDGSGAVPDGDGVLFSSAEMPKLTGVFNTFVPSVYVGDYFTGLWWMAESDEHWISNDEEALIQLERVDGQLQLRVRFVAIPAELEGERTLSFALMASPTALRPADYRRMEWGFEGKEPFVGHDTSGYRYYGTGVNGFQLYTDEDYAALKDYFYSREDFPRHKNQSGEEYVYPARIPMLARQGLPVILYGSIYGASAAMEEFPAYGSGWIMTAKTAQAYGTDEKFRGRKNIGGNRVWLTDDEVRPVFVRPTQSFYDAHLRHMVNIATKVGINGHFHDNYQKFPTGFGEIRSDVTGAAYRRPDGEMQAKSVVLDKHDWNKRFYTALWLAGRPPQMLGGNEQNNAFKRNWFVEGFIYVREADGNYITQGMTPDVFRGFTSRTYPLANVSGNFRPTLGPDGLAVSVNQQATRMMLAYGLLHDLGFNVPAMDRHAKDFPSDQPPMQTLFKQVDEFVDYIDGGAEVLPYWQDRDWIDIKSEAIVAGAVVAKDRSKGVVIAINTSDSATPFDFTLTDAFLGKTIESVRVIESGEPVTTSSNGYSISLKPYETVYLAVE